MSEIKELVIVNEYNVTLRNGTKFTAYSKREFSDFSGFIVVNLKNKGIVSFRKTPKSVVNDGGVQAVLFGSVTDVVFIEQTNTLTVEL